MKAADILTAIRKAHPNAAFVPEVVIYDHDWLETYTPDDIIGHTRRIDALMFQGLQRTAIEIKTSKADYRRETGRKRAPWERVTHRFIYAAPKGVLSARDIPHHCGLWEVDETGRVSVARKSKINQYPEPLPQQVVQALAYRASKAGVK